MLERLFKKQAEDSVADFPPEPSARILALEEVVGLDAALEDCDRRCAKFRFERFALVNGALCLVHPRGNDTGSDRVRILTAWKTLCDERARIIEARNKALARYAKLL